LLNKAIKLARR